jgi:hypothetical protein
MFNKKLKNKFKELDKKVIENKKFIQQLSEQNLELVIRVSDLAEKTLK